MKIKEGIMIYYLGQRIDFCIGSEVYEYHVAESYLAYTGGTNDFLFKVMGIQNKHNEMSQVYRHRVSQGYWPQWDTKKISVHEAVSRIVAWAESKGVKVICHENQGWNF